MCHYRHAGKFVDLETFIHSCGNYVSVEEVLRGCKGISIENFGNFFKCYYSTSKEDGVSKKQCLFNLCSVHVK